MSHAGEPPDEEGQAVALPAEEPPDEKPTERRRVFAGWKSLVLMRVQRLDQEAAILYPGRAAAPQPPELWYSIRRLLAEAEAATAPTATDLRGRLRGLLQNVPTWLTGADIERSWAALHQADELLYNVRSDDSVRARASELLASARARLDKNDPRRDDYEATLQPFVRGPGRPSPESPDVPRIDRAAFVEISRNLNQISDDSHGRVRNYRNVVLTITLFLTAGVFALAFDPPSAPWLPINHGDAPWPTIWQVEVVGALGGLLAAVTTLRGLEGFAGPYSLPLMMGLLKIPAGALTGLLGALWMQNGVFSGLQPQDGLKILAYVALFGYAQQTLTTFADKQAGQLLGQAKGTP